VKSASPIIRSLTRPSTIACTRHDLEGLKRSWSAWRRVAQNHCHRTREPSPFCQRSDSNPYAFSTMRRWRSRNPRGAVAAHAHAEDAAAGSAGPGGYRDGRRILAVVRDADELHDALLTLIVLPPVPEWGVFYQQLMQPVAHARSSRRPRLLGCYRARGTGTERRNEAPAFLEVGWIHRSGDRRELAGRSPCLWTSSSPPWSTSKTKARFSRQLFSPWRFKGNGAHSPAERCARYKKSSVIAAFFARIHRMIWAPPREIEPVTALSYAVPVPLAASGRGSQLHGVDDCFRCCASFRATRISGAAWESSVLPSRPGRIRSGWLDRLCLRAKFNGAVFAASGGDETGEVRACAPPRGSGGFFPA